VEKWYEAKMQRHTRERAQWVAAARKGEDSARDPLLSMFGTNDPPYWQAAAVTLLERWIAEPKVLHAVMTQLTNDHPLVREKAVRALGPLVEAGRADVSAAAAKLLNDPIRSVRVGASWTLRATVDPQSRAGRELQLALDHNADQPGGQLQKGVYCLAREQLPKALTYFQKAVAWDPHSAPLHHEMAIVLSKLGRNQEALGELQEACRLEPKEAEYQFKLGLAWAEAGSVEKTVESLQQAVKLDPRHARAWYNLGLAQNSLGKPDDALVSLARAEAADANDPIIPYARATILARLGRVREARTSASRALEIQPDFSEARELLNSLQ
jgi:tetratricopeptide (TPR) repeat protein